jgi:hypothetical protein
VVIKEKGKEKGKEKEKEKEKDEESRLKRKIKKERNSDTNDNKQVGEFYVIIGSDDDKGRLVKEYSIFINKWSVFTTEKDQQD